MKKITLLFPDSKSLWAFAQTLRLEMIQINSLQNFLTCSCSDAEISTALMKFNAEILDEVEERIKQNEQAAPSSDQKREGSRTYSS